ncbi:MAG: hypothetical protein IJP92_17025 [Lachnospiraceae bacterium]|nr:hypothetical protein [Lachnospiraceae bacterium]
MGQTICEKVMSRCLGKKVYANAEELFYPDMIIGYDYPGYIDVYHKQMVDLGIEKVEHPERGLVVIDHFNPAGSAKENEYHKKTWEFAQKFGYAVIDGKGIGHVAAAELGYVKPGMLCVHFDGHVSTLGAVGACCFGVSSALTECWALQSIYLVVPPTLRVNFKGSLGKGVAARDVYHSLLRKIGPCGALNTMVEFGGEGLQSLNMDDRYTLCNLIMFVGARSAICEQDALTEAYLKKYEVTGYEFFQPDDDAQYQEVVEFDLSTVEPVLVAPPSPANTVDITEYLGRPVHVGLVGSCAAGRVTDFAQMLEILDGRHVKEGFRLNVAPVTTAVQAEMADNGMMAKLIKAGARMYYPSCDFCYGKLGVTLPGETALSTGTLNVPGRMGCKDSDIFNASPYSVAAAAVTGEITDPRTLL